MIKRIAILRGGPSSEYEVSLKTGKSVLETLGMTHKYYLKDIVLDRKGDWFIRGIKIEPETALRDVDCVFNALHGEYGEDGKIQQLLEKLNVPFTGTRSLGAALSMNKLSAKKIFAQNGLKTPFYKVIEDDGDIELQAFDLFRTFVMPVVIKPLDRGSSVGVSVARDYQSLLETLISLYNRYDRLLVEEYIHGKEATVGVIEKFRNQDLYSLLPVEIRLPKGKLFFDYTTKYGWTPDGITNIAPCEKICPGNFSEQEKNDLKRVATMAHNLLGLRHYSRSDFVIHPKRGVYILETNSLPGLTNESLLPKSLEQVGSSYPEFLEHVIELAMTEK